MKYLLPLLASALLTACPKSEDAGSDAGVAATDAGSADADAGASDAGAAADAG